MNCELKMVLEKLKGKFICVHGEKRKEFSSVVEFEKSDMEKGCIVSSISTQNGAIVLELKKWEYPHVDMDADWVKEHEKQFGEKPSFF